MFRSNLWYRLVSLPNIFVHKASKNNESAVDFLFALFSFLMQCSMSNGLIETLTENLNGNIPNFKRIQFIGLAVVITWLHETLNSIKLTQWYGLSKYAWNLQISFRLDEQRAISVRHEAKEICLSERRAIHYQLRAQKDVGKFQ